MLLCVQRAPVTCSRAAPKPGSFQCLVVPCSLEAGAWINPTQLPTDPRGAAGSWLLAHALPSGLSNLLHEHPWTLLAEGGQSRRGGHVTQTQPFNANSTGAGCVVSLPCWHPRSSTLPLPSRPAWAAWELHPGKGTKKCPETSSWGQGAHVPIWSQLRSRERPRQRPRGGADEAEDAPCSALPLSGVLAWWQRPLSRRAPSLSSAWPWPRAAGASAPGRRSAGGRGEAASVPPGVPTGWVRMCKP